MIAELKDEIESLEDFLTMGKAGDPCIYVIKLGDYDCCKITDKSCNCCFTPGGQYCRITKKVCPGRSTCKISPIAITNEDGTHMWMGKMHGKR